MYVSYSHEQWRDADVYALQVSPTKIMSVPTVVDVRSLDMVLRELPEPIPLPSKWSDFNKQQYVQCVLATRG